MADATPVADELTERALRRVGRVLREKWKLDSVLGVGGMAAVYAATHRNGSRVAVKVLHPELSVDPTIRKRFLREGYVANQVDHPGSVRVIDDDEDDGAVFLVMDLLQGETLEARWTRKGRKLPADEVLSIADQVLDVVAAAHDKGIIHRDIKPENLFLTREGQIKILDFGIARLRQHSSRASTRTGSTLGTPAFMPPEQARGRWDEVDARSDLWAIGATLFTLATGRLVHEAGTENELLLAAMTKAAPTVLSVTPELDPHFALVVDRALAFTRDDRWPDARSMQEEVRAAYAAMMPDGTAINGPSVRNRHPEPSTPPPNSEPVRPDVQAPLHVGGLTGASMTRSANGSSLGLKAAPRTIWIIAGSVVAAAAIGLALAGGSKESSSNATPSAGSEPPTASSVTVPIVEEKPKSNVEVLPVPAQVVTAEAVAIDQLPSDRTPASESPTPKTTAKAESKKALSASPTTPSASASSARPITPAPTSAKRLGKDLLDQW